MKFLTNSLAFLLGIASFASTANADCMTDFNSDAFQSLVTMGESDDDEVIVDIPALCLAAGGDVFAFSGTTTCGDQVDDHFNDPMCLPTSCTSSNEAGIALMIPMIIFQEESCIGSYTYDGLGDGTPDSLSCQFDFMENIDTVMDFAGLYINEAFKMFSEDCFQYLLSGAEPPEECLPDYTGLQTLCQENDMDYFTLSFTETCDDGSSLDVQDIPQCFPSSCTSDEAALKAMLADMTSDESDTDSGPVCTESDYIFSGLDEEEEEKTTSGGCSFRASIAGSVLMLAVASALL